MPLQSFYEDLADYQAGPQRSVEEDSYVYRRLEKAVSDVVREMVCDELQGAAERFSIITAETNAPPRATSAEPVLELFQLLCLSSAGYLILPKSGYAAWDIRYQQPSPLPQPLLLLALCDVIGRQQGFAMVACEHSIEEEQRFWQVHELCQRWQGYHTAERTYAPAAAVIYDVYQSRPFPHSNRMIAWLLGYHAMALRELTLVPPPPRSQFDAHYADTAALTAYLARAADGDDQMEIF